MKEEIQKFFRGEVEDSDEVLSKYSRDASIFEVRPKLVLFPMDSKDVQNLVKWVSENKDKYADPEKNKDYKNLSITCRCAGTDMSGGAIGESLILDFTRHMNKLVRWNQDLKNFSGLTLPGVPVGTHTVQNSSNPDSITVQPGMFYRDFEKITLEKGLILPCYTASKSLNAMGGMFGNNSAGERTLKYGKTEDYILETKIVFSDGNEYVVKPLTQNELTKKIVQLDFEGDIYKNIYNLINKNKDEINHAKPNVHKNSAGYYIWNVLKKIQNLKNSSGLTLPGVPVGAHTEHNSLDSVFFDLNKLLVGSQGTLGIATEITFKLVKNPKHSKLVVIFINDLESLGRLVKEILQFNPETLETYDDKTMKLAVRFFPDFLKNKGLLGMIKFMWSFIPELGMMFKNFFNRKGFPKLIVLTEFAGDSQKLVYRQCISLKEKIKDFKLKVHITKSEEESEKYWDIRRESFSLLRKHVAKLHTAPFIDDIIVRPEFLPKFIPELNKILEQYKLVYTIAGHVGDGNFHIIPLMDFRRLDTPKIIMELGDKVYDLVIRYQGSITAEHNDGIIRTHYLKKMYGTNMIMIFKDIKKIFDKKNIFNIGKKIISKDGSGTKEYAISHIALEHNVIHKV
ncbi:FAD-binding oxidoreductase [Candidatus Nomurabacteria bacterium CG_4_10_14_0_2_um_filter_30_12]|uniref:D-lactate dehydrogenase (cytochrome) n=1 Tax=Candidatus Nomurabacteria bacterium CG_4_10_14_0_2_um_filter_30_12 TaxID=1974727 RepID=A0A2J0MJZ8_9BACT|nr:MAG: FAD-binding oxidoreductase [Candidatus Nomurabacteria bacterium CG_4_10_14_0_2_um_filter_30_12]